MAIRPARTRSIITKGVQTRTSFKALPTLHAETFEHNDIAPTGRLSQEHADMLRKDRAHAGTAPTFVVFSYGTPIAWHTDAVTWRVPDARYSVTTTNHQSAVRAAIG